MSTIARIGAVAFVTLVITITALEMHDAPQQRLPHAEPISTTAGPDPLRVELSRCQSIGMAAAGDSACLRAWAENRRRFLAPGARPEAAIEAPSSQNISSPASNGNVRLGETR